VANPLLSKTNALSKDGTADLDWYEFSNCGKYFAYSVSLSVSTRFCHLEIANVNLKGSKLLTIFVRSADSPFTKDESAHDSGRLPEEIKFVKYSAINWSPDSKGFFYQVCLVGFIVSELANVRS